MVMKKILILGGTQFIGRNLVEQLLEQNQYELTLFNRQSTNSTLFPDVRKIKGDRQTDDIKQIATQNWDFVIDLSCYYPSALENTLKNFKQKPKKYIFMSTCSVYDMEGYEGRLREENTKILDCTPEQRIEPLPASYGNKKAECERILAASGIDHVIFRPSLVYGKYDHTDRFYYWIDQARTKDVILMPDNGDRKFAITYVDDLVKAVILALTHENKFNIYNVISIPELSIRNIVEGAVAMCGDNFYEMNATPEFLKANKVKQWTDMPLWIDNDNSTESGKRLEDDFGITPTKLQEGIKTVCTYYKSLGWPIPKYGMKESRRQELIDKLLVKKV